MISKISLASNCWDCYTHSSIFLGDRVSHIIVAYKYKFRTYSSYYTSTSHYVNITLSLNIHWQNCKGLNYTVRNVPICLVLPKIYRKPKQRWMNNSNKNIFINFNIIDIENKHRSHMKPLLSYNFQYFLFSRRAQVVFKNYWLSKNESVEYTLKQNLQKHLLLKFWDWFPMHF